MAGSGAIARYRIIRRKGARKRYDNAFAQLEMAGRQNAVFLSNVSHELRTPINMVLGISEVVLEKENSPEIREDVRSIQLRASACPTRSTICSTIRRLWRGR